MSRDNWDERLAELTRSRFLYLNDDYLEFLVSKVWRLSAPSRIVDFGCGFGYMGLRLLPLLPDGSSYVGIDQSRVLLDEADRLFSDTPYEYRFIHGEVYEIPVEDDSADVAVSHTVMQHLERPMDALREMIRVTRHGGLVISCDANVNAWNALFYIHEENSQERVPLGLFQQMNKDIREKEGRDYNIGMKMPVLMHQAGLKDVQSRLSDCVRCILPPATEYQSRIHEALCSEGMGLAELTDEAKARWRKGLLDRGCAPDEVDAQIAIEIERDFADKGMTYHGVYPGLLSFSFGTVDKETS